MAKRLRSFCEDQRGLLAVAVALAAPAIMAMCGAALDFASVARARSQLQNAADAAALAGANSLRLANTSKTTAASLSDTSARSASRLPNLAVATDVSLTDVQVRLSADVPTAVMKMFGTAAVHVEATARARVVGSLPTCLLVLDPSAKDAYDVDSANISATGCASYSNSTAADSISLDKGAILSAGLTCSAGGAVTKGGASFAPVPQTDCPARVDPLADRAAPAVGSCVATNLKIAVSTVLVPGTYCGGIELQKDATVLLQPGVYVLKDGPLKTNGNGSISGTDVTFYLTGNKAVLNVDGDASLNLTAPALGPMAGLLVFEDRTVSTNQTHKLHSRNAPNLLGTIYLSRNKLQIGAKDGYASTSAGMAEVSAWTVIIVRLLSVSDKISLVLNTNYDATVVKPPPGIAPAATARLVQ